MTELNPFFKSLFDYDVRCNEQLHKKLKDVNAPEEITRFFAHVMNAQNVWQSMIKNIAVSIPDPWHTESLDHYVPLIQRYYLGWIEILKEDLDKTIEYKTFSGDSHSTSLKDILFQVINHSTHHRGQITTLLRQHGIVPDPSDYIFYLRTKK